jgi:hypothetical protein
MVESHLAVLGLSTIVVFASVCRIFHRVGKHDEKLNRVVAIKFYVLVEQKFSRVDESLERIVIVELIDRGKRRLQLLVLLLVFVRRHVLHVEVSGDVWQVGRFGSVGTHFRQHPIPKKVGDDRKVHRCRVEAPKTWGLSNRCRRQLPLSEVRALAG